MDKKTLVKKIHPWRNCIATLLTIALIASCIMLLSRSRSAISRAAIRSSEIFRRYNFTPPSREYTLLETGENFHEDFNRTYSSLYGESSSRFNLNDKISLGDGDVIGIHSGGRRHSPEGSPEKGQDDRRWVDARIALGGNSKVKVYGAGGVGLQTGQSDNEQDHPSISSESLSVGGGFGFSYRLNDNAELLFDYRHSSPLNSDSSYRQADSAGFTLHISF